MTLTPSANAKATLGITVDGKGLPSLRGADGAEQLWLVAQTTLTSTTDLPENSGARPEQPKIVTGTGAIVTTPDSVFGVISPQTLNDPGLAFLVPLKDLQAQLMAKASLFKARPVSIVVTTEDWSLDLVNINRYENGMIRPKCEPDMSLALNGIAAIFDWTPYKDSASRLAMLAGAAPGPNPASDLPLNPVIGVAADNTVVAQRVKATDGLPVLAEPSTGGPTRGTSKYRGFFAKNLGPVLVVAGGVVVAVIILVLATLVPITIGGPSY